MLFNILNLSKNGLPRHHSYYFAAFKVTTLRPTTELTYVGCVQTFHIISFLPRKSGHMKEGYYARRLFQTHTRGLEIQSVSRGTVVYITWSTFCNFYHAVTIFGLKLKYVLEKFYPKFSSSCVIRLNPL